MQNLVIISPSLLAKGPLVEAEIYPNEISFLRHKNREFHQPGLQVKLLIDTGSNISGLNREMIDRLQLPLYGDRAEIEGAGGSISLNRYRCVLYLRIFGTKALPMDIVEGSFNETPYDGVLGRDVLQYCTLQFDGPNNVFRLSAPGF
jgi:predicted aspartyl protease